MEWAPKDTIPKDGTVVQAWFAASGWESHCRVNAETKEIESLMCAPWGEWEWVHHPDAELTHWMHHPEPPPC